jgi:hypothetical protein
VKSLTYVSNISGYCKHLKKKIGFLIQNLTEIETFISEDLYETVMNFTAVMPLIDSANLQITDTTIALELLEKASPTLQIAIFAGLAVDFEHFSIYEEKIEKLLFTDMSKEKFNTFTSLHILRFFSIPLTEKLFYKIIIFCSTQTNDLNDISLLCHCISNIFTNTRNASKVTTVISIECIRLVSGNFFKIIVNEEPTFKHLKSLSKMYTQSARILYPENQHYLISSFVSNICSVKPIEKWNQTKQKMLQNAIFPLFQKVSKEQCSEVSIGLHETHRQQFQILYDRWQKEARFMGKV